LLSLVLSAFPKPTIVEVTPVTVPVKAGDLMALLNLMVCVAFETGF
jgi:hypothetical protein